MIECAALVGVVSVFLVALFLGYKVKADKKSIQLEKNDHEHAKKHHHNEERIKELEKKNGAEQHQIDELKEELKSEKKDKGELKDMVIKLQERIINYEKKHSNGKKYKKRH
jgi:uncharacterized protein HemX